MPYTPGPLRTRAHPIDAKKMTDIPSVLTPANPYDKVLTASKVIYTAGPASQSQEAVVELLKAGATCCRVDLSYGDLDFHRASLAALQAAMKETKKICAVMIDTQGREMLGEVPQGQKVTLGKDQDVVLVPAGTVNSADTRTTIPHSFTRLSESVKVGDEVFVGNYLATGMEGHSMSLVVTGTEGAEVYCKTASEATLFGTLTMCHLPEDDGGAWAEQPVITAHDEACIVELSKEYNIDFLSLAYTRDAEDVLAAKEALGRLGCPQTRVVAKLETRGSLRAIDGILATADGVMLSRDILGWQVKPWRIALVQKDVAARCNVAGVPCIMTRVVDSMVTAPRPTRAEANDVANAVLDGYDAILLGSETFRGCNAAACVATVRAIAREAEKVFDPHAHADALHAVAQRLSGHPGRSESVISEVGPRALSESGSRMTDASPQPGMAKPPLPTYSLQENRSLGGEVPIVAAPWQMGSPMKLKQESIASTACHVAEQMGASAILVLSRSGNTATLVAKYRPSVPIITLVIPTLVSDSTHWKLEGAHAARRCLLHRGLVPILASPGVSLDGAEIMREGVDRAAKLGYVRPFSILVAVLRVSGNYVLKLVQVDESGCTISKDGPIGRIRSHLTAVSGITCLKQLSLAHKSPSPIEE